MLLSTYARARDIVGYAEQFFEKGNQTKQWKNVWRVYVYKKYGISYRTFLNYVKITKCVKMY